MPELTYNERLQRSLLDRLTDDEPDKQEESRYTRVLSPDELRECVRRDLTWLFNATNLACVQPEITDPDFDYGPVARSVINYGLPDFTGRTTASVDKDKLMLEGLLYKAICDFEPRLRTDSVKVRLVDKKDRGPHSITFFIEAVLLAQPLPIQLFLRTAIDLETGDVDIADLGE